MQAAKKATISALVTSLEALSPVVAPVDNLHLCAGTWELLYSTITITVGLCVCECVCLCVRVCACACLYVRLYACLCLCCTRVRVCL
jgi:hypothetical protein